jgi:hypothetical protein
MKLKILFLLLIAHFSCTDSNIREGRVSDPVDQDYVGPRNNPPPPPPPSATQWQPQSGSSGEITDLTGRIHVRYLLE